MTNKPEAKLFVCDCMGEGIMVTVEPEDFFNESEGSPYIGLAFWECTNKFEGTPKLTIWERLKLAIRILKGGSPYLDQVFLRVETAKKLANHILYLIRKSIKEDSK